MTTKLGHDECGQRLRGGMRSFMWGSRANSSGFRLARGGRTAVRIRGTFVAQPGGGTVVEYRIEFLPVAVVSLAKSAPVGFLVLGMLFWLAHQSLLELWWFVPLTAFVVAANLWVSEIQRRRLIAFVMDRLEAS